jgi:hypothetical protein
VQALVFKDEHRKCFMEVHIDNQSKIIIVYCLFSLPGCSRHLQVEVGHVQAREQQLQREPGQVRPGINLIKIFSPSSLSAE